MSNMSNFLKKLMSCGCCGPSTSQEEEKKDQYKCKSCGSISEGEPGECCGAKREKVCSCGSGKPAKECCEA